MQQVLLIEDDPLISKTLKLGLPYEGFEVVSCETFREGLNTFRSRSFDLILLDLTLPDGSGYDLCREFRTTNDGVPILILSANTDENSVVRGIEEGADDYLRKPYGMQELSARMKRLVGRFQKKRAPLLFGSLQIDPENRTIQANGSSISLGRREFDILVLLAKKSGEVLSREEILNGLGQHAEIYDRTIDSHLSHLRRKLKESNVLDVQICPVYGVGYRLERK